MPYIRVQRYGTSRINQEYFGGFNFRLEVIEAEGIDKEIFLFHRGPVNPYTNKYKDEFETICSPVDLEEYPVGDPDPTLQYPFFRKSSITLVFRSQSEVDEIWNLLKTEICVLLRAVELQDELRVEEQFSCGEPATSEPSSSSESLP